MANRPAVVGRLAELAAVRSAMFAPTGPRVLVTGPAGIGKTILLDALSAEATDRAYLVRRVRGAVSESDLPFAGLHDLLGGDVSTLAVDLPSPLRVALKVALLETEAPEQGQDALAVNVAVLRVFQAMLDSGPVAFVIDDIQWLDAPTRGVLTFALRRLTDRPLAVLAALRGEDDSSAATVLAEPRTRIRIGPLSVAEIADVVALRTGRRPTPLRAAALNELSDGNPYLAVEIARAAADTQLWVANLPVPARIRPVLAARVAGLSEGCRQALLGAALLSRPRIEVVDRLGDAGWLGEAEENGVIHRGGEHIAFDHPLLAAAVRDEAGTTTVRAMHRRLAGIVDDVVERARHLALGTPGPDPQVAAEVEAAAQVAHARAAPATAAELARHALLLTAEDALEDRARRAVAAATWFALAGEPGVARDCVQPLVDTLPPGADRARCLWALALAIGQQPRRGLAICEEALAQPGIDASDEVRIRLLASRARLMGGDFVGAHDDAVTARAVARTRGWDDLLARATYQEALTDLYLGLPLHESSPREPARSWPSSPAPVFEHPDLAAAFAASWSDDNATAAQLLERLTARARESGDVFSEWALSMFRAEVELRRAQIATALKLAEQAYRLASDGSRYPTYLQAHVAAFRGDAAAARTLATEGLRLADASDDALVQVQNLLVLGFTEVSCADYRAAAVYEARLRDLLARMRWGHPGAYRWQGDAVEAFLGVGRVDEAAAVTAELWEQADRLNLPGCTALASRCQGLIYSYLRDSKRALDSLHRSIDLLDGLDLPFERARTLLALGVVRRRARQKAAAREALTAARELFAAAGCPLWTERASDELKRAAGATGADELTAGERAVAEQAAAGLRNEEIAARLFLSPRTVESVLTQVYRKLGVRSRTELARRLSST